MLACEVIASNRSLSSRSKPFTTDNTIINTDTAMAMPSIEMAEIRDTKLLALRERT